MSALSSSSARARHNPLEAGGVYTYDLQDITWVSNGKQGLNEKSVRKNETTGDWLGVVAFEPGTRSGMHQHLATAVSYFLGGSLSDYQGFIRNGEVGINLTGATHDAMSFEGALLLSKLNGPVALPLEAQGHYRTHGGAVFRELVNANPQVLPDINIEVASLPMAALDGTDGGLRTIFDYAPAAEDHRFCELRLLPGASLPPHKVNGRLDLFVLGGQCVVNSRRVLANSFVVIEPGTELTLASAFGVRCMLWSEAPVDFLDGRVRKDPYGY